jgi:uncharacterized repeat protein (TIGR03806 family)
VNRQYSCRKSAICFFCLAGLSAGALLPGLAWQSRQQTLVAHVTAGHPLSPISWRSKSNTPDQNQDNKSNPGVGVERVFPKLRFDRPVYITGAGDGSGRLFVVEQAGVVRVFSIADHAENDPAKQTAAQKNATSKIFLDIRDKISRKGNEEGLIGLAFHPDYKNNGQCFVHYSSKIKDMHGIVARYRVSQDDPDQADPDSEEVVLEQQQPFRNHNGGPIEFGPDGFLYISFGDGGSANDPQGNGQKLSTWLGKVLRIDVDNKDKDLAYAVPTDNPLVDQENVRPEIWAFGLRNIWRMSFDRKTGELWAGDVGQNKWEEVDIIKRGGNYGWNRMEADTVFRDNVKLSRGDHEGPVAIYGRQWGWSITGGYVYRGKQFPELIGKYFYGDYVSGNLWQITKQPDGKFQNELVRRTGRSIASFGEDDDGELYLASFDGGIYRVVPTDKPENTFANWPKKLSETGLYESTAKQKVASHLIPYAVNAPFWSDGADKERFIVLPEGKKLGYKPQGSWDIPVGTTIVKNFKGQHLRGKRMLETRLIKRTRAGWEAATYVWDARGREAVLAPGGQQFELYQPNRQRRTWDVNSWHAPSSSECASCHVDAAGYVLGINTMQLNRDLIDGDKNQIETWAANGFVDLPEGFSHKKADRLPSPYDENETVDRRARAWLDVNCAMCHQPNGPGNANIDLRYQIPLAKTKMVGEKPAQGNLGMKEPLLLSPGDPKNSMLFHRVETLGEGRMPGVASNQIDKQAVELLRKWISELKKSN